MGGSSIQNLEQVLTLHAQQPHQQQQQCPPDVVKTQAKGSAGKSVSKSAWHLGDDPSQLLCVVISRSKVLAQWWHATVDLIKRL